MGDDVIPTVVISFEVWDRRKGCGVVWECSDWVLEIEWRSERTGDMTSLRRFCDREPTQHGDVKELFGGWYHVDL